MTASPSEAREEHTRILRMMLAVDDSVSYWRRTSDVPAETRVRTAYEARWFGDKSETRVRTLLTDMSLRFDRFPRAIEALRAWDPPRRVAAWLCHFHTQLADPIYRRFTSEYLPQRRLQGHPTVDREAVARWVNDQWSGRWSPVTCVKFGSNLLATAYEAGLFKERRDPRTLSLPRVPAAAVEYLFYLLREVDIDGSVLDSPYLATLAAAPDERHELFQQLSSVRVQVLGDVAELSFAFPDLLSWAKQRKEAA